MNNKDYVYLSKLSNDTMIGVEKYDEFGFVATKEDYLEELAFNNSIGDGKLFIAEEHIEVINLLDVISDKLVEIEESGEVHEEWSNWVYDDLQELAKDKDFKTVEILINEIFRKYPSYVKGKRVIDDIKRDCYRQ